LRMLKKIFSVLGKVLWMLRKVSSLLKKVLRTL
jgi:hypothetical protein